MTVVLLGPVIGDQAVSHKHRFLTPERDVISHHFEIQYSKPAEMGASFESVIERSPYPTNLTQTLGIEAAYKIL